MRLNVGEREPPKKRGCGGAVVLRCSGDKPSYDCWVSHGFSVIPNFGDAISGATGLGDVQMV